MASPEEPAVAVEEVQDSAETVIATVVAIVAGLIVIVIALGFRRKREAERVVAREKAAAAKRKAPPPGAVARADLSAVEKLARTAGADPNAFLAGLATTEVLGRLSSPLSPAAAAAVRKALAGKAELPPEGDGAAAVAAALIHTHLRRGELPARLWPKRDADEAEAAVEAVAEAAVKLTRHGFEAACKGGSLEAARCLLQLLACLRLQRPAWDHEPSRRASEEALADAGLPLPRLAASASAASWMGGAGGAVSAGSVAMLKVRLSRAHAKEAAAAAKRGATSFAGKWSTANGRAPVRVCESYTCLVSRRGGPTGGAEAMIGFLEVDVLDPAAPTAEAELKIVAPLEAGEYELRVQALSLAVLGVEASASASLVVTPAPIDDADDLDDY